MNKKTSYILVIIYIVLLLIGKFITRNFSNYFFQYYPFDYLLILLNIGLFFILQNQYNKLFIYLWLIWQILGNFAAFFSYIFWPAHTLFTTLIANHIYMIYISVLGFAFFLSERIFLKNKIVNNDLKLGHILNNKLLFFLIVSFPILMLIEMYIKVGYLPLLTGERIVEGMYRKDYGYMFRYFGSLSIISAIFLYYKSTITKNKPKKCFYIFLFCVACFASCAHGARIRLLIILFSLIILVFKINKEKINYTKIILFILVLLVSYSSIEMLRTGYGFNAERFFYKFMFIGGEYRDWAYTTNIIKNTKLTNYNWFASSLIQLFSRDIISLLGLNFHEIASMSSASYFMRIFNAQLGIRIGLIGELYYAYGSYGPFVFFIISLLFALVNNKLMNVNSIDRFVFFVTLFSLNVLTVMGQSNSYFSSLKNLVYLCIANELFKICYKSLPSYYVSSRCSEPLA